MATRPVYLDDVLRESWNDDARIVTFYDEAGTQTEQRPYTVEENAQIDAAIEQSQQAANKSTIETNLEQDLDAMQAIIDTPNADLRADPSQEIKEIARAVRRLTRMALDDYSGTE